MRIDIEPHTAVREARPSIMGFLSIGADTFDVDSVVTSGLALSAEGANIIEVGGDSNRTSRFQTDLLCVIQELVARGIDVSINTSDADTALLAADRGASYIHDVSGGAIDTFMPSVAAGSGLKFIGGCWEQLNMPAAARLVGRRGYSDVIGLLDRRVDSLLRAGLAPENLVLECGFGLAERPEDDWQVMQHLNRLCGLGYPLLVDVSRKRFLKSLVNYGASEDEQGAAALAVSVLATGSGVWAVRVRNVARTHRALRSFAYRADLSWLKSGAAIAS